MKLTNIQIFIILITIFLIYRKKESFKFFITQPFAPGYLKMIQYASHEFPNCIWNKSCGNSTKSECLLCSTSQKRHCCCEQRKKCCGSIDEYGRRIAKCI